MVTFAQMLLTNFQEELKLKKNYNAPEWEIELFRISNEVMTTSYIEGGGQGDFDEEFEGEF